MRKIIFLLLSSVLITSGAYAGGSIFGHHKTKNANPYGVYAIGLHVCSSLECPEVRIVQGKCDGAYMTKHWGVCVCDEGYVAEGNVCVKEKDIDTGVCENGNVYLSYMDDPCATETPMIARTCTDDNDCREAVGCCDTTTHKCKAYIYFYNETTHEGYFSCPVTNTSCKKNSDCVNGEFCNLIFDKGYYDRPDTGTCTPIGEVDTYTYINGINKTFWISNYSFSWWGAENWCKAQGKKLVSWSDFRDLFECTPGGPCNIDKLTNADYWQDGKTFERDAFWLSGNFPEYSEIDWMKHAVAIMEGFYSYAPERAKNLYLIRPLCE